MKDRSYIHFKEKTFLDMAFALNEVVLKVGRNGPNLKGVINSSLVNIVRKIQNKTQYKNNIN